MPDATLAGLSLQIWQVDLVHTCGVAHSVKSENYISTFIFSRVINIPQLLTTLPTMRGFLINCLYFVQIVFVASMSQQQATLARHIMKVVNVPQWSAITDSALHDNIAFTDQLNSKVWIDSKRMLKTPKTFANVVTHEAMHLRGAIHQDGQLGMSYAVTQTLAGEIVEDNYLLLPELAAHPALAQPALSPQGVPVQNISYCSLL